MVWFYQRGPQKRSVETRLAIDHVGYELVIDEGGPPLIERFDDLATLLAREHEVLAAWQAQGWRAVGADSAI